MNAGIVVIGAAVLLAAVGMAGRVEAKESAPPAPTIRRTGPPGEPSVRPQPTPPPAVTSKKTIRAVFRNLAIDQTPTIKVRGLR